MAGEKFYFIFSDEPNTKYWIDEPEGYSEVDFVLEQKENRMGRDESLNGGENRFKFTDYRNHYLDKLLFYYHSRGFESEIILGIVTLLANVYESELHFVDVETDELTYLSCRTISKNSQQLIKSRRETKVDMFSSVDIDGNYIEPLAPSNMLQQTKPTIQISEWEQTVDYSQNLLASGSDVEVRYQVNPVQNLVKSGIQDTYTFFTDTESKRREPFLDSSFKLFQADSNLINVKISVKSLNLKFTTDVDNNGNGYVNFKLKVFKGSTFLDAEEYSLLSTFNTENQFYSFMGDLSDLNIGTVYRNESVWIFFEVNTVQSTNVVIGGTPRFEVFTDIYKGTKIIASAESLSYNSIIPTFRLIDVMRQVLRSISGNPALSQRYDFAGELYDNVLFNGNLMRGETEKPFYVSLDDIEKSIWGENKGDTEIQEDGSVFVGIEKDFYTDIECGFFDNVQFEDMAKNTNPKYALNEFKFKYSKYQSLKEETQPNSESTIHGESIWTFFNKRATNKLEANVEWVRDAILIDAQQRLSTKISDNTATQDDDTIFCVDVLTTENDQKFTETTKLQHTYSDPTLTLRSNGEVNFLTLGIKPLTTVIIEEPNINAGTYTVQSVLQTELVLVGGVGLNPINDGLKITRYTYEIKKETIPLTNRTDEAFTAISNLISPDKYSNLRYSIKRNILNYWNSTLATANLFWKENPLRSTYYKNNGKCSTTYAGLTVVENEPFVPTDPILSPYIYNDLTFANVDFDDYIILRDRIKKDRGYIRAINKNMRVIKVYPQKVTYVNAEKKLVISGEEKFEKAYLTISNEGGIILVNDETRLMRLDYSIENNEVSLFDKERFRLYNPVFWDKVSVNGANAENIEELISWLDLLS